ncbi:MAG: response regulator transcription factor [Clostridia bacterium]|nr:response regulator transcription factor [Clostridia bacterium]
MIRIAIVEDEEKEIACLISGIKSFFEETGGEHICSVFSNGLEFLDAYRGDFDVVFMDIEMPRLDGYKTSQKLREKDPDVQIVFVTNLSQYAVRGYEVDAVGFIVKPVTNYALKTNLRKAIAAISRKQSVNILASTRNGIKVMPSDSIIYVEVMKHTVVWHTENGDVSVRGVLKDVEKQLDGLNFSRCNNYLLINLKFVSSFKDDVVCLKGGEELPVSRGRKKEFLNDLLKYIDR